MNNSIAKFVMFTIGAAVGSVVTWKVVKTKYERIAQEEIDSVKETFRKRASQNNDFEQETIEPETTEYNVEIEEYKDWLTKNNYNPVGVKGEDGYNKKSEEEKEDMINKDYPYVISPDEFGEYADYEITSLTYYADGVLTDEYDNPIDKEDIEELVGEDALNRFGEYEDDSVFVRDDTIKMDYEILADASEYCKSHSVNDYPVE